MIVLTGCLGCKLSTQDYAFSIAVVGKGEVRVDTELGLNRTGTTAILTATPTKHIETNGLAVFDGAEWSVFTTARPRL